MEFSKDQVEFIQTTLQFRQMMLVYQCAIKEVRTKLEILNDELTILHGKNTIESISSRVKTPLSIFNKLKRKGVELSLDAIEQTLQDVAGIRVICSFIDDIYAVADMLARQDDITILNRKDYIKNPKPNGYRSLHLILTVPVFFSNEKKQVKVEVQIRTIAMDFWASLEHQLKYKKNIPNVEEISHQLLVCSEVIAKTDEHMQHIREMIDAGGTVDEDAVG
nr:GTP pyrophosphokinase family protein [bacterium]